MKPSKSARNFLLLLLTACLSLSVDMRVSAQARGKSQAQSSQAQASREQAILQIQGLLQQNQPESARAALNEAMKRYPGDSGLLNLLGIIEAQSGNYQPAERAFLSAIDASPRFANAYLNLGRLYQENSGNDAQALPRALKIYQQLLRYQPNNAEANYQSAVLLQQTDNAKASLPHLQRLSQQYQTGANVLALYCAAYAAAADKVRTNDVAERLLTHADLSEPDVLSALPVLIKHGRTDLALRFLEELQRRALASAETLRQLGLLYEEQNQLVKARKTLETAGAPNVSLLLDLARVAFRQTDYQGALGFLAHARDLEPRRARIHYLFGETCVRLELVAEAHQSFVKAVELEPDNPEYNYAAGAASAYLRDPAEAIPYFRKFLKLRPNNAQGHLLLGAVLFKTGDYDSAKSELKLAMADRQTASNALYYLGRIARQKGRFDEALRELQSALQINPRNDAALAEIGQLHLQRRDYAAAEKALQQALAIDSDNYAANFNLLTLYSRTKDAREADQAAKFEKVKQRRTEREQDFLRAIETRPR